MTFIVFLALLFQNLTIPVQPIQVTSSDIVDLLLSAQESIFLVTPIYSKTLEQHLKEAASGGIRVYLVSGNHSEQWSLSGPGVEVRTLESLSQGLLLVDKTLVAGGILSGQDLPSLQIDTSLYGFTITDQLRALWQLAKEAGE